MTIKDRFRRALRKSDSSSSLSQSDSNTTANTSQSSLSAATSLTQFSSQQQSPKAPAIRLTKTFTWGRDKERDIEKANAKEEKRKAKRRGNRPVHPSEKPLTAQNLRHQEMLSHFTMTFGATHHEHLAPSIGGVSPCGTRPASIIDMEEYGP